MAYAAYSLFPDFFASAIIPGTTTSPSALPLYLLFPRFPCVSGVASSPASSPLLLLSFPASSPLDLCSWSLGSSCAFGLACGKYTYYVMHIRASSVKAVACMYGEYAETESHN